jgi:phosphatidylglycerol lysyltransferase
MRRAVLTTVRFPAVHFSRGDQMDEETLARLEDYAFRFGRAYDSYLAMDLDGEYFWSSDRRGVLRFARHGRYVVVIGGLLAPPDAWDSSLAEFMEFAGRHGYHVTFSNVDEGCLHLFRKHGFELTQMGQDAVLNLAGRTWNGKDFEWVRRQSSYCRRRGLACCELRRERVSPGEWQLKMTELDQVSQEDFRARHTGSLRYFVGRFDPERVGRRRLFLACAQGGKGRVEAFLMCNPCRNGELWAIETIRRRDSAPRGTIAFLIHQATQMLQAEGVPRVSLCLIPALRYRPASPDENKQLLWFMDFSARYLGWMFDLRGLYHFKSRFRPDFVPSYAAGYPRLTLMSMYASLKLWGIHRVHPLRLTQRIGSRWLKLHRRRSLTRFAV